MTSSDDETEDRLAMGALPDPVLGVLIGRYPARTMPIAMQPEEDLDDTDGSA